MKTKQKNMIAKFTAEKCLNNAKNFSQEKELVNRYLVIDKKTEKVVVDCRCYMGRSSNSSQVHAAIWVNSIVSLCDADGFTTYTSGGGSAGGYGYHKESAAIGDAISSAGFTLFGNTSEYGSEYGDKPDFKKICHINGVGESAIRSALLAIAYACGSKDVIFV